MKYLLKITKTKGKNYVSQYRRPMLRRSISSSDLLGFKVNLLLQRTKHSTNWVTCHWKPNHKGRHLTMAEDFGVWLTSSLSPFSF